MQKRKSSKLWPVAMLGVAVITPMAYVARTLPDNDAKNNLSYILENDCIKSALDLGSDLTFTAYPNSVRFKYTCDDDQIFWSNK